MLNTSPDGPEELDVLEPKLPEQIYKSHLEDARSRSRKGG